jgi:hypothetical protein
MWLLLAPTPTRRVIMTIKRNTSASQTLKVSSTTIAAVTVTTLPLSDVRSLHWPTDCKNTSGEKDVGSSTTAALRNIAWHSHPVRK